MPFWDLLWHFYFMLISQETEENSHKFQSTKMSSSLQLMRTILHLRLKVKAILIKTHSRMWVTCWTSNSIPIKLNPLVIPKQLMMSKPLKNTIFMKSIPIVNSQLNWENVHLHMLRLIWVLIETDIVIEKSEKISNPVLIIFSSVILNWIRLVRVGSFWTLFNMLKKMGS